MKITITLKEAFYDCKLNIIDSMGNREHYIMAVNDENAGNPFITVDVYDSDFDLILVPLMPDLKSVTDEMENKTLLDKVVKKGVKFVVSSFEKIPLRVGTSYRISGIRDGDNLDISMQIYVFGKGDPHGIFGLFPVMYGFFEVFCGTRRFIIKTAFETNRRQVLRAAKAFILVSAIGIEFLLVLLFEYPIQVGRVKRLTKNKTVRKKLIKFSNLNDADRQKFLDKQEQFLEKV